VLATHPIQYYAPLFRQLAADPAVELTVYYAHRPTPEQQGAGFGVAFTWDVDLLEGYRHLWLVNRASNPDPERFGGCDTPEIRRIIARERFDAFFVLGWNTRSYWQAMTACWRTGTPVMVRGDSQLVGQRPVAKETVKRIVYPLFLRRFSACLSVGTRSDAYFRHYGARRVIRSPHFVDNEYFATRAAAERVRRGELRRRWALPDEALVVLSAAKFVPKKRQLDLIHAVGSLGRSDVCVLFVGDGELRGECEAAAARLGVNARFVGFLNQSEIARGYAAADVLALPSDHRETWGLVVNEAMAAGLPAIVSDAAGCAPDLVHDGKTGFVFPVGQVNAIADRIGQLANDRAAARHMGRAATAHIAQFSVIAAANGVRQAMGVAIPSDANAA
jgi:glycosyltransferase involved in cell wall biosynthesis